MLYVSPMRTCRSWTVAWCIGLVAGLAAPVYAGWGKAKLIGHGNEGVIAVDQEVAGYVSTYSPLALDAQDHPRIAYFGR